MKRSNCRELGSYEATDTLVDDYYSGWSRDYTGVLLSSFEHAWILVKKAAF